MFPIDVTGCGDAHTQSVSMSTFKESRFLNPSGILSFIASEVDPKIPVKSGDLSWAELGEVLQLAITGRPVTVTSPRGSAWEKLRSLPAARALAVRYPSLGDVVGADPVDPLPSRGLDDRLRTNILAALQRVSVELSVYLLHSDAKSKLGQQVITPLLSLGSKNPYSIDDIVEGRKEHHTNIFPLTRLAVDIVSEFNQRSSDPSAILAILASAHVAVGDIDCLYLPLRLMVRELVHIATLSAPIDWPESYLALCRRVDLILSRSATKSSLVKTAVSMGEWPDSRGLVAVRSLETDKATDIKTPFVSKTDADQMRQRALLVNAHKVVARPVGRGACLFASSSGEVESAGICLNGKFPTVGVVSLDLSLFPVEALFWPELHNGVASLLESTPPRVTREWILGHKTKVEQMLTSKRVFGIPIELIPLVQYRHAGFLFGLGLTKQLGCLRQDDIYRYLKVQNDCVSAALILGCSISASGSCSQESAKLCLLHLPHLPFSSSSVGDIDVPPVVQAASVAGLGFVYAESGNRKTLEILIKEINIKPVGDKPVGERESYSVSAGFGLGLVCLAKGPQTPSDLRLADRLMDLVAPSSTSPPLPAADNAARVSLLLEQAGVNHAVTLPGACIALALAYLRSNDEALASRIRIPATPTELEAEVRSDSLLFKHVTRSLILFDSIQPSLGWIESALPPFLRNPATLEHKENRLPGADCASSIDWLAVYQARMFGITGLAIALGLKFAGSRDAKAKSVLVRILSQFVLSTNWPPMPCAAQSASRPSPSMAIDRNTIETCRCGVLLALAVVMAGSGDLDTLRLARVMQQKSDDLTQYGINLGVNLATGILFLGGGKLTLGNSNMAIACLLQCIIPRYPSSVTDNRSMLQLMRHLYVVAVEQRAVVAVDTSTMQPTSRVPVEVAGVATPTTLPCTLPRTSGLGGLTIVSDRYLPVSVPQVGGTHTVHLTRQLGRLPHEADRSGSLGSDRAYISAFTEPTESEVRKLLGLPIDSGVVGGLFASSPGMVPLSWIAKQAQLTGLYPTSRVDWRGTPLELAAVSWPPAGVSGRLEHLTGMAQAVGANADLAMAEKHASVLTLLHSDTDSRSDLIRLMDKCVKQARVDLYLDMLELRLSTGTEQSLVERVINSRLEFV